MKAIGRGFACIHLGTNYHFGMHDESRVNLIIEDDGTITIATAMQELGQGTSTTLVYLVSESFGGMDFKKIHFPYADSMLPNGGYTAASRVLTVLGRAVHNAAENLTTILQPIAAEIIDADPESFSWQDGNLVSSEKPELKVSLNDLCDSAKESGLVLEASGIFIAPRTTSLEDGGQFPINSFSYATAVADVEVDTDTGQVRVIKLTSIHDSGKILNPDGAVAQVEGGLMMGLGFALTENFISHDCIPIIEGFTQYAIPTVLDMPNIEVHFVEGVEGFGPLGAKGLAEVPMVVAAPAITNAIYDAVGVRIKDLPVSPERIVRALRDKNG